MSLSLPTIFSCLTCILFLTMILQNILAWYLVSTSHKKLSGVSFTLSIMVNSHYQNITDSLAVIFTVAFWEFQWLSNDKLSSTTGGERLQKSNCALVSVLVQFNSSDITLLSMHLTVNVSQEITSCLLHINFFFFLHVFIL